MSPRIFFTLAVLAFFQLEVRAQAVDSDGDGLSDFIESFIGTNPTLFDTDSDGLGDGYELSSSGTNPLLSDTDGDGLLDGLEVFVYFTDPKDNDSDNDDLGDGNEIKVHATNPKDSDTDDDGMPDGWEVTNTFAPKNASDAALDADSDGLTNLREFQLGTNPRSADTDADGMPDGWESQNGLALLANDASLDADSDGLTNLREYQLGTNPKNADSDNDGIVDGVEVDSYATSPNANDTDNDGLTDYQELFVFGTNAIVANPMPAIPVFIQVGDPQNPDDDGGQPDIQNSGRGYVGQEFTISTTEITNWMYALFLNSVAKRDRLYDLYKADMGDSAQGGIVRRGSGGSYTYEVKAGFEDKPVNFVSLGDVLRYINWLHNWKVRDDLMRDAFRPTLTGFQDQDASTTEDGVYALRGKNPVNFTRHPAAKFFLPDVDEWHKAAYYDPAPGGNRPSESYWDWATQKMNLPTRDGLAASNSPNDLHPVGTATGNFFGPSHYGTFDQDGNVAEWTQDALILGGRATSTADSSSETAYLGFRVASPVADASGVQETIPLAVEIGEPGNLNDEEFARTFNSLPAIGAVNYAYKMGAYEVTNRDYARFLNAKAKEDSFYRLYDVRMESDAVNGGITRSGENGSYVYSVKRGMARKPVVFVSIFSAMRYCNWLHNGGRTDSDTEAGAYRLLGNIPTNTSQLTRNSTARYYLPNAGEFYKAAYYDSSTAANVTFDYWKFATRSDSYSPALNSSVPADVNSTSDSDNNNLYDAGAASFFGAYGLSGNVGYVNPGSGANTPAPKPTAANTGELLEEATNNDDESATQTFRIAAAVGVKSLSPLGDADSDGLPNAWEVLNGLDVNTNDAGLDPDNDGLANLQEYTSGTDPNDSDSDNDGMPDGWEVQQNFAPKLATDAAQDADSDGLTNLQEYTSGTDPNDSDSDNDGMPDGWEVQQNFAPKLATDAAQDADSDGLTNIREYQLGTNPRLADTDGDTLKDGDEVDTHRTGPLNPDTDGDGLSDGVEITGGTNPLVFTQGTVPLMVEIGEPGNLDDEEFGREFYDEAIGKVSYAFQMGAYEVTNRDYVRFLNTKAKEDAYFRLFDARMETDTANGGIIRTGENGSYSYAIRPGFAKKPVVYVSVFSAMRYCNWIHNGGRPDSGMESGAYALLGSNPANNSPEPPRSANARVFLPNAGEFYKAAYYDSTAAANTTFDYWKFATRSDEYSATHNTNGLVDVDFSILASYFGTYGQSGNVGYTSPGSGKNEPANSPTTQNAGELIDTRLNNDDEIGLTASGIWTFRVAAALGVETLRPLADQDGDGMPNGWEVLNGLDPFRNDAALDPDSDGLTNLQEFLAGTDPSYADSDSDGMPDGWEMLNGLARLSNDAGLDGDVDGLTNLQEFQAGTDPRKSDTDGDGMPDGWEVQQNFAPKLATDAAQDADSDGLTNLREFRLGTNPRNRDTDGDGLADGAEVDIRFTDPKNADTDSDGLSDSVEIAGGTDPLAFTTPLTAPTLVSVAQPGNVGDGANFGYGAVSYAYRIGAHEVTNGDYAKFLNEVARVSDPRSLYDARMSYSGQFDISDPRNIVVTGGIVRSGAPGNFTYTVKSGFANKPVNFVSYESALRYCNWLHNGGVAGADTESGAYSLSGAQTRSASARFWLPNRDEWYKAAAYDAAAGARYWKYAIRSDSASPSQVAVQSSGGLVDVTTPGYPSAYGTYGQSGNAAEWMEKQSGGNPTALGGSILSYVYADSGGNVETASSYEPPTGSSGRFDIGFRIASVANARLTVPSTFAARYPGIAPADMIDGLPAVVDYLVGGTLSSSPAKTNYPAHSIVGGKMRYSLTARTDDPSLDYEVQTATTLSGPWTTNNVTALPSVYISSELSRRTFEVPITGEKQRFFRLQVSP